jgi:hypothetical protein
MQSALNAACASWKATFPPFQQMKPPVFLFYEIVGRDVRRPKRRVKRNASASNSIHGLPIISGPHYQRANVYYLTGSFAANCRSQGNL